MVTTQKEHAGSPANEHETATMAQRLREWCIDVRVTRVQLRPEGIARDWDAQARHWYAVIFDERYDVTDARAHGFGVFYSQGSAHTKRPTAAEILDALRLDASAFQDAGGDFDRFCADGCYEAGDYARARAAWKGCKQASRSLKALLDTERYEQLLYHTEAL